MMGAYNLERIKSVIQRAQMGQELTIAFLGGSITQGSLATEDEKTYAYRVYRWWCETFPQTRFNYVNGGIGGTDSYYGVSRAVTDVLMYQPDFLVIDFSVNDVDNIHCKETFEGLLRKILAWPSKPAVLDGDTEHPVLLDGNFDQDWGDCLYIEHILHHGEQKRHTLEITVLDDQCAGTTPFYLMSIIVADFINEGYKN